MTLKNTLLFDLPVWDNFSPDCKDLLVKLLRKDAATRINIDDALKHPWFSEIELN